MKFSIQILKWLEALCTDKAFDVIKITIGVH